MLERTTIILPEKIFVAVESAPGKCECNARTCQIIQQFAPHLQELRKHGCKIVFLNKSIAVFNTNEIKERLQQMGVNYPIALPTVIALYTGSNHTYRTVSGTATSIDLLRTLCLPLKNQDADNAKKSESFEIYKSALLREFNNDDNDEHDLDKVKNDLLRRATALTKSRNIDPNGAIPVPTPSKSRDTFQSMEAPTSASAHSETSSFTMPSAQDLMKHRRAPTGGYTSDQQAGVEDIEALIQVLSQNIE